MEVALLARYKLERTDERTDGLTCVTLQLPAGPAFFVELVGAHDDQRRRLHGIVAVDGTTELVPLRDAKLDWAQLRGGKVWFETVDLDGDGREDLVVHRGDARHATAEKIDVVAIREHALVELEGPKIAYDDSDLDEECRGTLAREKAGKAVHLVVDVTRSSGPTEHCMAAGRHVYELAGDRLLELGPSR